MIESQFLTFIAKKKNEGYAVASLQVFYSSIRSFFEIHYFPLKIRKGDYPKGDSNGVRRATKEPILRVINDEKARNKPTITAMVLFIKESGLRIGDVIQLNYGDIAEQLEKGATIIQLNIIRQKTKLLANFHRRGSNKRVKNLFEARRKGSTNLEPETIITERSRR